MKVFTATRRKTVDVKIGNLTIGSNFPIAPQSMTNTKTEDTLASVEQAVRIAQAGGKIVRLTAQGRTQAQNLEVIRAELIKRGCRVPLCADIHFNPELAIIAATSVEKVRINPGNYGDVITFRSKLLELIDVCKVRNTALRIGVNHGSLSKRMVGLYGDSPKGMVESAMEFLRVCKEENFNNVVVSLKSSNVRIMVESYRMAVEVMDAEGLNYPIHLGVTEAGEGEDGRVRSAVGIGALLADGIGDTIRISLTEEPECEIPVAQALIDHYVNRDAQNYIFVDDKKLTYDPLKFKKRRDLIPISVGVGGDFDNGDDEWFYLNLDDLTPETIQILKQNPDQYIVLSSENSNWTGEIRACIVHLTRCGVVNPIILYKKYHNSPFVNVYAAADMGSVLVDGLAEGVWVEDEEGNEYGKLGLTILQACRLRMTKTEIISCPGCGRTLYDLQEVVKRVKERLGEMPGLKIAVMGCIVNGPGEMADADYGYVGAGENLVWLYKNGEVIEKNIPHYEAVEKLAQIIENDRVKS